MDMGNRTVKTWGGGEDEGLGGWGKGMISIILSTTKSIFLKNLITPGCYKLKE